MIVSESIVRVDVDYPDGTVEVCRFRAIDSVCYHSLIQQVMLYSNQPPKRFMPDRYAAASTLSPIREQHGRYTLLSMSTNDMLSRCGYIMESMPRFALVY